MLLYQIANWRKKLNALNHSIHILHLTDPIPYCGASNYSPVHPVFPTSPFISKPLTLLTLVLPGTCGQWKHEVSAEQSESTSFPGVRKQLIACRWEPKCDMSPHPTAEISHVVLIQAHAVTQQSYALLQQACTHRSNRQRIISKSKNSNLIRVCSLRILETIWHTEIIYWQNTNPQNIYGAPHNIKTQAYSTA